MILTSKLTSLDAAIHRAVLADSFTETRALLEQYGAELERVLYERPVRVEDVRDLMGHAQALFQWASVMVQTSRAHLATRLANARGVSRYHAPAARVPRLRTCA